jgi:pilus assembly protein Flp/PilA
MRGRRRSVSGAGMTEWMIIVALIAIAAIGIVCYYGEDLRGLYYPASAALAGIEFITSGAKPTKPSLLKHKDLGKFATKNYAPLVETEGPAP